MLWRILSRLRSTRSVLPLKHGTSKGLQILPMHSRTSRIDAFGYRGLRDSLTLDFQQTPLLSCGRSRSGRLLSNYRFVSLSMKGRPFEDPAILICRSGSSGSLNSVDRQCGRLFPILRARKLLANEPQISARHITYDIKRRLDQRRLYRFNCIRRFYLSARGRILTRYCTLKFSTLYTLPPLAPSPRSQHLDHSLHRSRTPNLAITDLCNLNPYFSRQTTALHSRIPSRTRRLRFTW